MGGNWQGRPEKQSLPINQPLSPCLCVYVCFSACLFVYVLPCVCVCVCLCCICSTYDCRVCGCVALYVCVNVCVCS